MSKRHQGSIVVEALLLTPLLMMFVLLVVYVGRWTTSAHRVAQAANVGARAASQSSLSHMATNGKVAAAHELQQVHESCRYPEVHIKIYKSDGVRFVNLKVSCVIHTVDLGLLHLPTKRVTASSTEVVDVYTQR